MNRHSVFYSSLSFLLCTAPAISWIFPSLLPLLVLLCGEICCILLLPVLYPTVLDSRLQKQVQNLLSCQYFLHSIGISRDFSEHASSSYCQPGILEHSAKYRSRIHPRFSPVFRNVGCSVFAGIWSSDRYGTSLYSVSFC